jgi:lipoate---protein ligase
MDRIEVLRPGPMSAEANMERDRQLLAEIDRPTLHLYEWEGECATYGHFIRPSDHLNLEQAGSLSLARRPTGGGILFHTCDLAFSVLVPEGFPLLSQNTLENYQWVNKWVLRAIEKFMGEKLNLLPTDPVPLDEASGHFCMAKPTIYDIMIGGLKVGGAAQRRTKKGLLHQGSIYLTRPAPHMMDLLHADSRVAEAMGKHSHPLLGESCTPHELEEARGALRELLVATAPLC